MKISCPSCRRVVGRQDKKSLVCLSGATLRLGRPGEANSIRCKCGKRVLLLRGSL